MSTDIRSQLTDLYLSVKVRKSEEINDINEDIIDKERENMKKLPLTDIINYIKNSIDTLIELKAIEKYEQKLEKDEENKNYINQEDPNDLNGLKLYEGMLIAAEKNIRSHIRVSFYYNKFMIQNEQELKLIIDELEAKIDEINNGRYNKKLNDIINNKNNESCDNKYKDLFIRPNNTGLMNHLKKENERLRKLIISYELKNKKNIYKLDNNKNNFNNFAISKFNFKIIQRVKEPKEKKDINRNSIKEYKYDPLNKSIESKKKLRNISKMKKPKIEKIKDINLFDNDYTYMKGKEDLYKKYNNTQIYNNNTLKQRNNLSQRNRKLLVPSNHDSINSNTMRVKNVIINKSINNYILKPVQNLSQNRSHSKIIKKRKIYDNSFINNTYMKTIDERKNLIPSIDKNNLFNSTNPKLFRTLYIQRNKKKENLKKTFYQKPIINKITIYNNINNDNCLQKNVQLSEKIVKKHLHSRYDNNNNNLPFRIQ